MMRAAPDRGHAHLPLHADRRRGPSRRGSSTASTRRSACSSRTTLQDRLEETSAHLNPAFHDLFDEMLGSRVDRLAATRATSRRWSRPITLYHMVIEGMLALTGQHFIITTTSAGDAARLRARASTSSPATSTATWPSAPASCATMAPSDPKYKEAIQRTLDGVGAGRRRGAAAAVVRGRATGALRRCLEETREFAMQALERRLKVIGLAPVAG